MHGELALISTRSMQHYVQEVAYQLRTFPDLYREYSKTTLVTPLSVMKFSDGEMEVSVQQSIREKDVFLFASSARNSAQIGLEENKMELYHAVDAIRRSRPARIILFEPYCSCSRSDRATRRNSVGLWVHYKTLTSLGVDHIVTYNLHSEKSKTILDPRLCAIEDVPGNLLVMEYIAEQFIGNPETLQNTVQKQWLFCSVDSGGEPVARQFAKAFGTSLIISHKQRDYSKANTVEQVKILSEDSIEGKIIWIVDDMIDTAGSVSRLVEMLHSQGVREVHIAVTHPVFSDPALERLNDLHQKGMLNTIVTLDTIDCDASLSEKMPFLRIIPSSRMSAEIIMTLHADSSMSPFFQPLNIRHFLDNLAYRQ